MNLKTMLSTCGLQGFEQQLVRSYSSPSLVLRAAIPRNSVSYPKLLSTFELAELSSFAHVHLNDILLDADIQSY